MVETLVTELQEATENRDDIEDAIEEETRGDQNGKRRAMMLRAVSLSSRSGVILNLSSAMKNLVGLERQAFNLNNGGGADDDLAKTENKNIIIELVRPKDAASGS